MALKFYNSRSKEVRVAETEPMIAAMFNSSDKGPNALVGQDFGWRIAPEVVIDMRRIKNDPRQLERIAMRANKSYDELTDIDILHFISQMTPLADAPVAMEGDYEDEYRAEISKLEKEARVAPIAPTDEVDISEVLDIPLDKTTGTADPKPEKASRATPADIQSA